MDQAFTGIAQQLDPFIYQRFKQALELGKWPDGRVLTKEQREVCMQAVISYEAAHIAEEERTGYMEQNCKSKSGTDNDTSEEPLIINNGLGASKE